MNEFGDTYARSWLVLLGDWSLRWGIGDRSGHGSRPAVAELRLNEAERQSAMNRCETFVKTGVHFLINTNDFNFFQMILDELASSVPKMACIISLWITAGCGDVGLVSRPLRSVPEIVFRKTL